MMIIISLTIPQRDYTYASQGLPNEEAADLQGKGHVNGDKKNHGWQRYLRHLAYQRLFFMIAGKGNPDPG